MRLLAVVLILGMAFAALRLAAAVIVLLLLGFVVVAAIRDPMRTFGCLVMFALLGAVGQYPFVGLIVVGGLVLVWLLGRCQSGK